MLCGMGICYKSLVIATLFGVFPVSIDLIKSFGRLVIILYMHPFFSTTRGIFESYPHENNFPNINFIDQFN